MFRWGLIMGAAILLGSTEPVIAQTGEATAKITIIAPPNMDVSPSELTLDPNDSTGQTFTVRLSENPDRIVTVTLTEEDGPNALPHGSTFSPKSLSFTPLNGTIPQVVTVTSGRESGTGNISILASGGSTSKEIVSLTVGEKRDRPLLMAAADSPSSIGLSWTAFVNNNASFSGYQIEVSSTGRSGWSDLVYHTNATETTYSHTGLTEGTHLCYRVTVNNAVSNVACATTNTATLPHVPTLTATAASPSVIDLFWTRPVNDNASFSGYQIEVSSTGRSGWSGLVYHTNATETAYSHTGLTEGTHLCYRVTVANAVSNVACATTDETPIAFTINPDTCRNGIPAGGSCTVTAKLSRPVSDHVDISGSWSAPDIGFDAIDISTPSLIASGQSVPLLIHHKGEQTGTRTLTLTATGAFTGSASVPITVYAQPSLVVIPQTLAMLTGETRSFNIKLNRRPASPATIKVSQPPGVFVSPHTLTLSNSNWNIGQTISVTSTDIEGLSTVMVSADGSGNVTGSIPITIPINIASKLVWKDEDKETTRIDIDQGTSRILKLSFNPPLKTGSVDARTAYQTDRGLSISRTNATFNVLTPERPITIRADLDADTMVTRQITFTPEMNNADVSLDPATLTVKVKYVGPELRVTPASEVTLPQGGSTTVQFSLNKSAYNGETVTLNSTVTPPSGRSVGDLTIMLQDQVTTSGLATTIVAADDAVGEYKIVFTPSGGRVTNPIEITVTVSQLPAERLICFRSGDRRDDCGKLTWDFPRICRGQIITIGIRLNHPPPSKSPTTFNITGQGGSNLGFASVSPSSLTFTQADYDMWQDVVVTINANARLDGEGGMIRVNTIQVREDVERESQALIRSITFLGLISGLVGAAINVTPEEVDIVGGTKQEIQVTLGAAPRGDVVVRPFGLTTVPYLSVTPKQRKLNNNNYNTKANIFTIQATDEAVSAKHTLTLEATMGACYQGLSEEISITTSPPPCESSVEDLTDLNFGSWRMPATGMESITINPRNGTTESNLVRFGEGTGQVGAFTASANYCTSCTITIIPPDFLGGEGTDGSVSFAREWADGVVGESTLSIIGDADSQDYSGASISYKNWSRQFQIGGKVSGITNMTPVGTYKATIDVTQTCVQ